MMCAELFGLICMPIAYAPSLHITKNIRNVKNEVTMTLLSNSNIAQDACRTVLLSCIPITYAHPYIELVLKCIPY